mgnify:CR=1 FL=1
MFKVFLENLFFSSHQLAHSGLNLSNDIIVTTAIAIDKLEFEVLHFFEEVGESECCGEVWVQIVFDLFSLTHFDPLVVLFLKQENLWIGLAECVHILQLSARNKKLHLHLHVGCAYHLNKFKFFIFLFIIFTYGV